MPDTSLARRLDALAHLRQYLLDEPPALQSAMHLAEQHNPWFTQDHIRQALRAIATHLLDPDALRGWCRHYALGDDIAPRRVGLVMAGNIPLVGFHDWLCTWMAGHEALIKLSEKDAVLLPHLLGQLAAQAPELAGRSRIVERLNEVEAVIATGSNNTARYFEAYFGRYPHIIRKNRHSVAILDGGESAEELLALGRDVFSYFGLGCRNVSKLFVPQGYDFHPLLEALHEYRELVLHTKYKNNFDHAFTLLILNAVPYQGNDCILLTENEGLGSPVAQLYYSHYDSSADLAARLAALDGQIQCVMGRAALPPFEVLPFGSSQTPGLMDYADRVDSMQFLLSLP